MPVIEPTPSRGGTGPGANDDRHHGRTPGRASRSAPAGACSHRDGLQRRVQSASNRASVVGDAAGSFGRPWPNADLVRQRRPNPRRHRRRRTAWPTRFSQPATSVDVTRPTTTPQARWSRACPASSRLSATLPTRTGRPGELNDCFGGSWGPVKVGSGSRSPATPISTRTENGAPLRAYMGSAAARDGRTWFSEDLGAWQVIVLDGNCGLLGLWCSSGSEPARWLREDLAGSNHRCTLALLHQPRFSSGQHGNDSGVAPLWNALYAAGADLVLDGHDHDTSGSRRRIRTAGRTSREASQKSSSAQVAQTRAVRGVPGKLDRSR